MEVKTNKTNQEHNKTNQENITDSLQENYGNQIMTYIMLIQSVKMFVN